MASQPINVTTGSLNITSTVGDVNVTAQMNCVSVLATITAVDTDTIDMTYNAGSISAVIPTTAVATFSGLTVSYDAVAHSPIVSVTGTTKTLALSDADSIQEVNNGSDVTITIPTNGSVAFVTGTRIDGYQYGAGSVILVGDTGVTINGNSAGSIVTGSQYKGFTLIKRASDEWVGFGGIE
jgi:hypothetical protein